MMCTNTMTVKPMRAVRRGLIVPDALVNLRHFQHARSVGGQACCSKCLAHCGVLSLVEECVKKALAALSSNKSGPRWCETAMRPPCLIVERSVGRERLSRFQEPAIRPQSEEAHVQGSSRPPSGTQEVSCRCTSEHGPHLPLEFDVLVVEGHCVVPLEAQGMQPHQILRTTPSHGLPWPPIVGPPPQRRGDGPIHLDNLHLVPPQQILVPVPQEGCLMSWNDEQNIHRAVVVPR
mmetsp:Transcript_74813/g.173335  ORF Transcript_74813/g.173335 Transcript_74813/m.173335 type:complete len:234 (+) Transcript_74813:465-1166(+)